MKKNWLILGLFMLNVTLVYAEEMQIPTQNIPSSVLKRYEELKKTYQKSLGAGIRFCTKDGSQIYVVSGSGGFLGVQYFYQQDGTQMGEPDYWTDVPSENDPKPPIDILAYQCTEIMKSIVLPISE